LLEAARWNRAALVGRMKGLRAAVLVGIGFSAAVGALALAVLPPGWASTTYLWPGIQTAALFALAAFAIRRDARALLMRRSQAPRMRQ
jgi:hypothetical protein